MVRITDRIKEISMLSLRPMQLMLVGFALLTTFTILYTSRGTIRPYSDISHIHPYILAAIFLLYAGSTAYSSLTLSRSLYAKVLRYSSSTLGILIWSIVFAAEVVVQRTGASLLSIGPACMEAWALAQLISKIHDTDRRAL